MSFFFFVLLSSVVFTGLILLLIGVLSLVEAKLVKSGDCKITINDGKDPLVVPAGKSLLVALSASKIFLPSACGGAGTCALCKCQILEGGGTILPTEAALLSRKEQKNHYRLSCQVKVKGDLRIRIPEGIFNIKKYDYVVRSNKNVSTFIKELVLELSPDQHMDFKPGEYIQIDIPPYKLDFKDFDIEEQYRGDWDKYRLWDLSVENNDPIFRAYSMANHPGEEGIVMLNVRIATPPPNNMSVPPGIASSYVFGLKPGQKGTLSGPYGEFFIKETDREMIYVGGGAGMAPLRSQLFHLFHTQKTKRKVSFWYGARSKREIFYEEGFRDIERKFPNFRFEIALSAPFEEDKWQGSTGFIHQVLYENYLKKLDEPEEIEYYLCGPPLMIEAVQKMLDSLGVPPDMIAFDSFG